MLLNNVNDFNNLATEFRKLKNLINIPRMFAAIRTLNDKLAKYRNEILNAFRRLWRQRNIQTNVMPSVDNL